MSDTVDVVLGARQVVRQYGATRALDHVDFSLRKGRVAALIGENGAGKSTLVKLLGGIETPDAGTLVMDGTPIVLPSVRHAEARRIAVIHQELNLCPNLSVADNIFLAQERTRRGGLVDRRAQAARASELLDRLEHPMDPDTIVGDLPVGQQQIVEIARALSRDVRVLMMDEPTSALSTTETVVLFGIIRELADQGVAVLYISHTLAELLAVADTVSVLRDGRMVAEAPARDVDTNWIAERMTGRPGGLEPWSLGERPFLQGSKSPRLQVDHLSIDDGRRRVLNDVSLTVQPGEIVGVYGLLGAGVTALLESIIGVRTPTAGTIHLEGSRIDTLGPADRIARGIAFVPEDRQAAALIPALPVRANLSLASLGQSVRGFWVSASAERASTSKMAGDLGIRPAGVERNIQALSGGNQQKTVIGRALLTSPKVLVLDEPTRGIDVGAKADIHALIRGLAEGGMSVILGSSDEHDIRSTAHRVVVLSKGAVADAEGWAP